MSCICIFLAGFSNIPNSPQSYESNPHDKENNVICDDESNWLHRNDAYQMQQTAGRLRAVLMLVGNIIELCIVLQTYFFIKLSLYVYCDCNKKQGRSQMSGVEVPQLKINPNQDFTMEYAG